MCTTLVGHGMNHKPASLYYTMQQAPSTYVASFTTAVLACPMPHVTPYLKVEKMQSARSRSPHGPLYCAGSITPSLMAAFANLTCWHHHTYIMLKTGIHTKVAGGFVYSCCSCCLPPCICTVRATNQLTNQSWMIHAKGIKWQRVRTHEVCQVTARSSTMHR